MTPEQFRDANSRRCELVRRQQRERLSDREAFELVWLTAACGVAWRERYFRLAYPTEFRSLSSRLQAEEAAAVSRELQGGQR